MNFTYRHRQVGILLGLVAVGVLIVGLRFLPAFVTKSVALADIMEAKPTRTSFIYGWGIHYTNRGWLYNVSGLGAVHVRMRNGKQFMLGTDEPAALADAINRGRATLPLS